MAVDYQTLNAWTVPEKHLLPCIDDFLDSLHGYTHFIKIHLQSGYHQVLVVEKDHHKMAFLSCWDLYKYNVIPLGIMNAPETFQRLMNSVIHEFLDRFLVFTQITHWSTASPQRTICIILGQYWTNFKLASCVLKYSSVHLLLLKWSTLGILLVLPKEWHPTFPRLLLQLSGLYLIIPRMSRYFWV